MTALANKQPKADRLPSPNYDNRIIPVEFLVLHYTAVDLQRTLDIFLNPEKGVSAHLVIDRDGSIYEMVDCLEGEAKRGWHAGTSQWQEWESFNDFSLGIELVNFNGNIFEYSDAQYQSLQQLVTQLKDLYPALQNAERVVGHEHIAGYRGKADPGACFDWPRFFSDNYPEAQAPDRPYVCPATMIKTLQSTAKNEPKGKDQRNQFWESASAKVEELVRQNQ